MKKLITLLTACSISISVFMPISALSEGNDDLIANGICGNNLTWELDNSYTLIISGKGEMSDWSFYSPPAWYNNRGKVHHVIITDGVTSIGDYAFYNCQNIKDISIPSSIENIGKYSMNRSLQKIYYSGDDEQWSNIKIRNNNGVINDRAKHNNVRVYHIASITPLVILYKNSNSFDVIVDMDDTCPSGVLYSVAYQKDGRFLEAHQANINSDSILSFTFSKDLGVECYKIMTWSDNQIPISDVYTISTES